LAPAESAGKERVEKRFTSFRYRPELFDNKAMLRNGYGMLDSIRGIAGDLVESTGTEKEEQQITKLKRENALGYYSKANSRAAARVASLLTSRGMYGSSLHQFTPSGFDSKLSMLKSAVGNSRF